MDCPDCESMMNFHPVVIGYKQISGIFVCPNRNCNKEIEANNDGAPYSSEI